MTTHKPDYLGWVHDSGLSFRHERSPAYKATREKLSEELQSDFDRGMERISQILDASRIPILALPGFEADDVIGTLAQQAVEAGQNGVVVAGNTDFQQQGRPAVWLLNQGRGGPASVEDWWVGVGNGSERLGVPPAHVTDYLAMVGDSSDNVPGVKGIGEKTAEELVESFGTIENILAHAHELTKKRPREALEMYREEALLSKELVTIRDDLDIKLDLPSIRIQPADTDRLRTIYVELEFNNLAKALPVGASPAAPTPTPDAPPEPIGVVRYRTLDTVEDVESMVARARAQGDFAIDTELTLDAGAPEVIDPLRSHLAGLAIAIAPGEAYYLPLAHRERQPDQGSLGLMDDAVTEAPKKRVAKTASAPTSIAARALSERTPFILNLPSINAAEMKPLRALLEDPSVKKTGQNIKFDQLSLRLAGIELRGIDFDTMIASYVLDPGRRSHGLDLLALEFLNHTMTSFDELCGKGKDAFRFDEVPIECARDFACEKADMALRLRDLFAEQLEELQLMPLYRDIEMPLVGVLGEMQWQGVSIHPSWFGALKERFARERQRVEMEIYALAGETFNINSNPKLREILFDRLRLPALKPTPAPPPPAVSA